MAVTTVPFSTPSLQARQRPALSDNQHRRRDRLGRIAGVPVAAMPVAASAVEGEDPHLGWLAEFYAERFRIEAIEDGDDAYATCIEIENRILDTEPTTMAGVAAQLMVIAETNHIGLGHGNVVTRPVLQRAAKLLPVPTWYDCLPGEAQP